MYVLAKLLDLLNLLRKLLGEAFLKSLQDLYQQLAESNGPRAFT